jgi:hypothetical protein
MSRPARREGGRWELTRQPVTSAQLEQLKIGTAELPETLKPSHRNGLMLSPEFQAPHRRSSQHSIGRGGAIGWKSSRGFTRVMRPQWQAAQQRLGRTGAARDPAATLHRGEVTPAALQ